MNHLELRIYDKREGATGALAKFSELLHALTRSVGEMLNGEWVVFRGAYGYGITVCAIEEDLNDREFTAVDGGDILPILLSDSEYFDNARIKLLEGNIEFGIHDNTFHYVKGERNILEQIAASFKAAEIVEGGLAPLQKKGGQ